MHIRADIELANLTDVGCQRTENEDYYCYVEPESEEEFLQKGRLIAVADGMGGYAGGQIASGLALEVLRQVFQNGVRSDPHSVLVDGFSRAQAAIVAHADEHPELSGMGTTCTAAIILQGQLAYGHIGDSRLYLLRDSKLQQLTEDHSMVTRLVKSGAITPEQAKTHEQKNVLTAALGMKTPSVAAEFSEHPLALAAGDVLVLASDGLHGLVTADEIGEAAGTLTPYQACHALVNAAKERGGPDNITVQILRLRERENA